MKEINDMGRTNKDSEQYLDVRRVIAIRDNYFHCIASLNNSLRLNDGNSLRSSMYEEYAKVHYNEKLKENNR